MMGDETFTCEICIEPTLLIHKFSHHTADSVHNFCFLCIASHIEAKIDENIGTIKCPELDCGKTLEPMECEPMIPPTLFVKWCDFLCKSSISTFKSSHCPNPNCSELILNECNDEKTEKWTCHGCKRLFCYTCSVPWHAGFWCSESESESRDENDVLFGIMVERNKWSRCPGCGQPIERIDGCNHILCRCGRKFCHKCGLDQHYGICSDRREEERRNNFLTFFFIIIVSFLIACLILIPFSMIITRLT